MILRILLTIIAVIGIAWQTFSQKWSVGFKAGLNVATETAPNLPLGHESDWITKFHGGFWARMSIAERMAVQSELLYSEQGSTYTIPPYPTYSARTFRKDLTYLTIPVLFRYSIFESLALGLGMQYSILLQSELTLIGSGTMDYKSAYAPDELGFIIGIEYNLPFNLTLGGRYVMGLTDISSYDGVLKSEVFQVSMAVKVLKLGK